MMNIQKKNKLGEEWHNITDFFCFGCMHYSMDRGIVCALSSKWGGLSPWRMDTESIFKILFSLWQVKRSRPCYWSGGSVTFILLAQQLCTAKPSSQVYLQQKPISYFQFSLINTTFDHFSLSFLARHSLWLHMHIRRI